MKLKRKHIISGAAVVAIAAAVFSCMNYTSVVLPDNPQANSTINIKANLEVHMKTSASGQFIVAMLVPNSWDVAGTGDITYSTSGIHDRDASMNDVTGAKMVPVESSDLEPNTNVDWATACMAQYGNGGNYGVVKWVCFKSVDSYNMPDQDYIVNVALDIKFKTGPENIKFNFGMGASNTQHGFSDSGDWGYWSMRNAQFYEMDVTGGTGSYDYTTPPLVSLSPMTFSYEDILHVSFSSSISGVNTALKGEGQVYLKGKVVLDNGQELTFDKVSEDNLMYRNSDNGYDIYIYPRSFFNVPTGRKMTDMYFWFTNADGTEIEDNDGKLFEQIQNGTLIQ